MELEVQCVTGIEDCFVSLPLVLIQTLQSTRAGPLPPLLALELRSSAEDARWLVAWAGATSSSSAIEVAQQYAHCVSLPNHTNVQVRAASNVPEATLVTIEPHSEDDWEILELNSEIAEAVILNQVRIVHEGMQFPLWLPNHTSITFSVVSTFPKKAVVQLVRGTEVAVAPKRRNKDANRDENSLFQYPGESNHVKALLRIQDPNEEMMQKSNVNGVELRVAVTSVAYIHQETARRFSIQPLQLFALVPRYLRDNSKNRDDNMKVETAGTISSNKAHHAIVRILVSNTVAKGHIMITRSVRLYLRIDRHSWVYLRQHGLHLKKEIASLSLSPCLFNEVLDSRENLKVKDANAYTDLAMSSSEIDWSMHDKFHAAISHECGNLDGDGNVCYSDGKKSFKHLLHSWFLAQLNAVVSNVGEDVSTIYLGNETLLQFEVKRCGSETFTAETSNETAGYKNNHKQLMEILYVLRIPEQIMSGGNINVYELPVNDECKTGAEKLDLGSPVSFNSIGGRASFKGFNVNISSLSWMESTVSDVINRLVVQLSSSSRVWFNTYNITHPGHVLVHGPSGSGKTLLTKMVGKSLEAHEDLQAHIIYVRCSELASEKGSTIQKAFSGFMSDALQHTPAVVIFDDLDSIISSASESDWSQLSKSVVTLLEFLIGILDEYAESMKSNCGIGPIAFIATVQSREKIPRSLTSSGRFDFHVQLASPASLERKAILKHEIQRRRLQCLDDILASVASKCDGYDAYDLGILVDRAVHAAVGRFLPSGFSSNEHSNPILISDDFTCAMQGFLPVAMRDITNAAPDVGHSGWDDIGGLTEICSSIKEMIELPSRFPNIFAQAPLRLRSNVLLYGPPGCGKTHIVGAAAAACSLRFISVKGPELLNKYIGASEQAVRDIFSKAAAAAPCLLFFDEFDSIAPKRGHDNTGVTDRVVNQFLTELDGVEVLTGVFVFAATSRPDLLDAALLRPGRLDRLLFCDFPSPRERLDILKVLSRKLPLASDVDLEDIAWLTEGFSGADLQALLSDAQLAAVHEILGHANSNRSGKSPIITQALLNSAASKARPSVSESEKQRLYNIYSQFLDSRRSLAAQSRDTKGKRATLA